MAARRALGQAAALNELVPLPPPPSPRRRRKGTAATWSNCPPRSTGRRATPSGSSARHGHLHATLAGLVHDALREKLDRLKADLNDGRDFPDGDDPLPAGRPLGR